MEPPMVERQRLVTPSLPELLSERGRGLCLVGPDARVIGANALWLVFGRLGLGITLRIVEAQGGTTSVESESGAGSTFTFRGGQA